MRDIIDILEIRRLELLNEVNEQIIDALKRKIEIQDQIIKSFETGEMIGGTYENKTRKNGKHCRECGRDERSL